jgi:radical SAM superfamily enzyme YgiQ (UPF0313 family)
MPLPDELFLDGLTMSRGGIRVAVVYPNSYPVGMASLGYQTVLRRLIEIGGCEVRRFFFDPAAGGVDPDAGFPGEADLMLVSIAYELDYINLVRLLISAGMNPRRSENAGLPLILAGGVAPSVNPWPLWDIADAVHMGDCEDALPGYISALNDNIRELRGPNFAGARDALFNEWATGGNIFIPDIFQRKGKTTGLQWAEYEGFSNDPGRSIVITPDSVWGDAFLAETSRGCEIGCKFCLIGNNQPNCRHASFDVLHDMIVKNAPRAGSVGLIGSSVGSYPRLLDLVRLCNDMRKRVGLSSLNIRYAPDELFALMAASGEHKVTMAVETGSERIQKDIGKVIPLELVIDRVRAAFDAGLRAVKLYFVVGLPGEGRPEVEESISLVREITEQVNISSRKGKELDVGISCFVPKKGTPWEHHPMASEKELRKRIGMFRDAVKDTPCVSVQAESPELSVLQGILSVGDKSVSEIIIASAMKGEDWRGEFKRVAKGTGWFEHIHEMRL